MRAIHVRFTTVLLNCLIVAVATTAALASVPQLMNYQGRLTNGSGTPIASTTLTVAFSIYEAPAGGTVRWADTLNVTTDANGMFSILLGSVNPIPDTAFTAAECWLGIKVGADPEMAPRARLVSVPYSYRVKSVDGATGGAINGNTSISGNVGVGTTSPGAKLDVLNGNIRASSQLMSAGIEFYPATAGTPTNAGSIVGTGGIPNNIAILPVGNVGVGTTNPTAKMDVAGTTGYNQVRMRISYTPTGTIDPNGNIGDVAWDANYIYVKTAGGWERAALSTW
jgi:hypothetical protein